MLVAVLVADGGCAGGCACCFFFFFFFFRSMPPTIWTKGPEWGWEATSTRLGGDRAVGPPPASLVSTLGACICSRGGSFARGAG